MAVAFDDVRRSTALNQIMTMRRFGLWTDEEVARFSEDTIRRTLPPNLNDWE